MTAHRFLLLEDSPLDVELIRATLMEGSIACELVQLQTRAQFLTVLEADRFDLILSDYSLPDFDGISALAVARDRCPEVPFIFVSATLGEELAIEALKNGATDYVLKQRLGRLVPSVQRALREARERRKRKRAEGDRDRFFRQLEQSNLTLQTLIECCPLAIIFLNAQGVVKLWNEAAEHLYGWSADEVIGQFLPTVPHRRDEFLANLQAVFKGRSLVGLEVQHQHKDGQRVDLDVWARLITDADGNPGCLAIAADVSERKRGEIERLQAEQTLQQNNERLKLLFETASDLLSTEQPLNLMNSVFSKLSAQMDLHYYFSFLVDEEERVLRLKAYGGLADETAQTLQQIEFGQYVCGRVAQERCQIVINNVQQSTYPNIETIRFLDITAFAGQPLIARGRLLGTLSFASKTRTSFTSDEIALLQATSDQIAIALEQSELIASLQQQTEQLAQANRIKDEFLAVLSHELRTPLNPILGWAKILRTRQCDQITVSRALETIERNAKIQTQLIEDLLDVSRILRGKLSLNVSQVDLGTTLEAAMETVWLSAEAKGIDLRFEILDCRLKDYSNEQDVNEPDQSPLNLQSPISNLKSSISNPKFQVLGDAGRLQQVIWNLLSNAVKFTPTGGRIDVYLSVINENEVADSNDAAPLSATVSSSSIQYAQIKVIDTGKGISPDFLPHVFDYFRQADGSTTRVFGGLGLGLAIAKHLVQLHGGTIHAESLGDGHGARFTVRLPLAQGSREWGAGSGETTAPSPLTPHRSPLTGLRVLLVDDEQDSLEFIAFLLQQAGATVTAVSSVGEALGTLDHLKPDVLVSDIGMPEEDGYMLLRQVRSRSAEQSGTVPAIALTAYAHDEDSNQAIAAGFQRHLSKPIEPANLIAVIAELTGRSSSRTG